MEYRRLGSTGMYVSEISYGNWITHGSQVEQEAAIKCVKTAFDLGITTFDTAEYLKDDEIIAEYLSQILSDGDINELFEALENIVKVKQIVIEA